MLTGFLVFTAVVFWIVLLGGILYLIDWARHT